MEMNKFTSLNRRLDPKYPTNLAIVLLSLLAGLIFTLFSLWQGEGIWSGLSSGFYAGLSVFFGWALAREIDPDHEYAAFVAAVIAAFGYGWFGAPSLLPLLWFLLLIRILNRTVGPPAKLIDSLTILGLGTWLAFQSNWFYGLLTALGFYLDSRLSAHQPRHKYFAIGILLIALIAMIWLGSGLTIASFSIMEMVISLSIAIVFVIFIFSTQRITSVSDITGDALDLHRVQVSQFFAVFSAAGIFLLGGISGLYDILPLWAAFAGVSLYWLFSSMGRWLLKSRKANSRHMGNESV